MTELHDLLWRWHDICQAECNVERPAEWWKPKPIDEAEFDRAERAFGFPLPEDVKDLYRFSNRGFMPILTNGMSIAPLTQLLKHGTSIPETRDIHAGEEDKWNVPGFLKAVPVTDNWPGIYISAAPEALGAVFITDHNPICGWIAASITDYFQAHIDYYEHGWLKWLDAEWGTVHPEIHHPNRIRNIPLPKYLRDKPGFGPWDLLKGQR